MNRHPCRCKRCGARRTLAKRPEDYASKPHCACGGTYRVDQYRKKVEHKRQGCRCSGFPWDNGTHRKGSASPSNGWYCYDWKGEGNAN